VIATIAFIVFFAGLGLSVLMVAMQGGPRGMTGRTPGRRSRRFTTIGLPILIAIFGLGLPYWILSANSSGHIEKATGGVELNASEARGRQLFAKNCATCHTLAGANASGRVGPNLDELQAVSSTAFTLNAIKEGRAQGRGQMPAGLLDGQDAVDVAAFVKAVAGR
jgi:mono/diheme cytochrome c family protein